MAATQSTKRKRTALSLGLDAYESDSDTTTPVQALTPIHKKAKTSPTTVSHTFSYAERPSKNGEDKLSRLSDELLIRILKSFDVEQVLECRFVSKRWRGLASDGEVWRGLYWERFVKRGIIPTRDTANGQPPTPKSRRDAVREMERKEKWIKEMRMEGKKKRDEKTDAKDDDDESHDRTPWMARYKRSTNWSKGRAKQNTISLTAPCSSSLSTAPPRAMFRKFHKPLARMHDGILYTADLEFGLRAWPLDRVARSSCTSWQQYAALQAKHHELVTQTPLDKVPTAIEIDTSPDIPRVAIGFQDGSWELWDIPAPNKGKPNFSRVCQGGLKEPEEVKSHHHSAVIAITSVHPYVLSITAFQLLQLHKLSSDPSTGIFKPVFLHDFRSHTSWPPYALTIRPISTKIVCSVAYAIPTIDWDASVGIQELHIDPDSGKLLNTRVVMAISSGWTPGPVASRAVMIQDRGQDNIGPPQSLPEALATIFAQDLGVTMSYTHPYLVLGSGNNRLSRYLVHSSADELRIGKRTEMYGHTAGVVGVDVHKRGRCVSVDRGGRVKVRWLEAMEKDDTWEGGVVVEGSFNSAKELGGDWQQWVGSDDDRIVVVRGDSIVVYDFR